MSPAVSRVGAPRLRPRRPFVCVGRVVCCVCWVCWADFVCGFWAGLGVLWCWLGAGFGVAGACVVIPCLRSYACWPCLGSVGGIATIGAALRRVVGVSGVYGRKTPRVVARLRGCVPVWWLGFAVVSGGVVSGGMSLVSLWLGSSLLVAWGELLP